MHHAIALAQASPYLSEFALPDAAGRPMGISRGPDGSVWFTEYAGNKIGRLTADGAVTEFPLPTPGSNPAGIVLGPDGRLWFTEYRANAIGRIDRDGRVSEFRLPSAKSGPAAIVAGPDGALWFTDPVFSHVSRIDAKRALTVLPGFWKFADAIAPGADGELWFATGLNGEDTALVRLKADGTTTTFPYPTVSTTTHLPFENGFLFAPSGIVSIAAADGAVWFTEPDDGKIGRIRPTPP